MDHVKLFTHIAINPVDSAQTLACRTVESWNRRAIKGGVDWLTVACCRESPGLPAKAAAPVRPSEGPCWALLIHCHRGTARARIESQRTGYHRDLNKLLLQILVRLLDAICTGNRPSWSDIEPSYRLAYKLARPDSRLVAVATLQAERCLACRSLFETPPPATPDDSRPKTASTADAPQPAPLILPGSFNPLHAGHLAIAEHAAQTVGQTVDFELTIDNADKPPLDFLQIQDRLNQEFGQRRLWLTNAATFTRKAKLFPGATFLVGADTIWRIAQPRFYGGKPDLMEQSIQFIGDQGCRFLVYGRLIGRRSFRELRNLQLPSVLTCHPQTCAINRPIRPTEFAPEAANGTWGLSRHRPSQEPGGWRKSTS